jgi:hypothetical protein
MAIIPTQIIRQTLSKYIVNSLLIVCIQYDIDVLCCFNFEGPFVNSSGSFLTWVIRFTNRDFSINNIVYDKMLENYKKINKESI